MQNTKYHILHTLLLLGIFLFIFIEFFHPISAFQQDLGRHLLLGKIILTTHQVPTTNLLTYTYPHFPFINTHWLSEVLFYLITQAFGTNGLLFIMAGVAALSVVIIYRTSLKRISSSFILYPLSLLIVLLYSGILLERTDLRPEIFSFLFMAIFMWVLWKYHASIKGQVLSIKGEKRNPLYFILTPKYLLFLLPIIELLWVNMHIYFVVGPLLIGLFLVDGIWTLIRGDASKSSNPNYFFALFLVFLLTCLATLLNPHFLAGSLYPFTVFHNYGYTIEENQSIFFLINYGIVNASYIFFFIAVFVLFLILLIQFRRTRAIDWLLAIVFTAIAASSIRNLPLFVFATLPSFVFLLQQTTLTFLTSQKALKTFGAIAILFSFFMLHLFISSNGLGYGTVTGAEKGVDFFINHHVKGPIFNNFDIGSYLEYRLFPTEKTFVDGRPEAYPTDFFQKVYIPMQQDPAFFQKISQKYHFESIFFSYTDQTPWARQFIGDIMQNPKWQLVYLDTYSALWVRKNGINSSVAKTFAITSQDFSINSITSTNPKDYYHLGYFFALVGWQNPQVDILEKIINLDPSDCKALALLSQNPSTSLLYAQKYQYSCNR